MAQIFGAPVTVPAGKQRQRRGTDPVHSASARSRLVTDACHVRIRSIVINSSTASTVNPKLAQSLRPRSTRHRVLGDFLFVVAHFFARSSRPLRSRRVCDVRRLGVSSRGMRTHQHPAKRPMDARRHPTQEVHVRRRIRSAQRAIIMPASALLLAL